MQSANLPSPNGAPYTAAQKGVRRAMSFRAVVLDGRRILCFLHKIPGMKGALPGLL